MELKISSVADNEFQFLQQSQIPTYHFQKSLRRLPIPKVEDSCKRLLASARPLLSDERYKRLEHNVLDFLNCEGPELQKELLAFDEEHKDTSYISDAWYDIYLKNRQACPINSNPFLTFAPDPVKVHNNQLARATNFIISFGRMKRSLDAGLLEPEVYHLNPEKSDTKFFRTVCRLLPDKISWYGAALFKAFPLDMSQYSLLFGGSRIPEIGKDRLHHCKNSKNFVVIYRGKFYAVQLFQKDGNLVSPNQVYACIAAILKDSSFARPEECIGSLTSLERNRWAAVRSQLAKLGENKTALATIDDALFVVCLDSLDTEDPIVQMKSLLAGGDASNRWFDKCFQLIVDTLGFCSINFEHSWGDGIAVLRLMEESFRDVNKNHFVSADQAVDLSVDVNRCMKKITFTLSDEIRKVVCAAQESHRNIASRLNCGISLHEELTRDLIKKSKLSPDFLMQLAIQLAFYKLYKHFVPTYESCSTAAFLKGRTECVRSATMETKKAVLAITNSSSERLYEFLLNCSRLHSRLVKEAAVGQGFDRHLLGLRLTAERLGKTVPTLFYSEEFMYMNKFILSTSTLTTDSIYMGGFGPIEHDGFGIGYVVSGTRIGATVTAYRDQKDAKEFCEVLNECLEVINKVVRNNLQ
uniref:Carn_acyltransf domain-containing protein n=1 Tax=Syphacia muris TaxID=451379 RepID=A0A0N5AYL8_9BILA